MYTTSELYQQFLAHPKVFTDSRKVVEGGLFFALKGERFDGNAFAGQTLEQGAGAAVVDAPELKEVPGCLWVPDVLQALQDLARHHRRQFTVPVLAITGSNGKTTTKELVNRVLTTAFKVHCTAGNFNNHIGVPLTLLAMPPDTEFAVIEMGANHQGEIDQLCRIAEPDFGLITNIGKAHLEGFGGIEGVKKGKSELYRFLAAHNGAAFINEDEAFLAALAGPVKHQIRYGVDTLPGAHKVQLLETEPFLKIHLDENQPVDTQLIGSYNYNNVLAALAIGLYFNCPVPAMLEAVATYRPQNNRSEIREVAGTHFVLDAYNANPTSVRHALTTFAQLNQAPKWVILGEMLELGTYSAVEHLQMLQLAVSLPFERVITVGAAFNLPDRPATVLHFDQSSEVGPWLAAQPLTDKWILLKGSRGNRLEKILDRFSDRAAS